MIQIIFNQEIKSFDFLNLTNDTFATTRINYLFSKVNEQEKQQQANLDDHHNRLLARISLKRQEQALELKRTLDLLRNRINHIKFNLDHEVEKYEQMRSEAAASQRRSQQQANKSEPTSDLEDDCSLIINDCSMNEDISNNFNEQDHVEQLKQIYENVQSSKILKGIVKQAALLNYY
jgi:hypothetical protein